MSMTGWILIGIIVLTVLFVIGIYNRLVRLRALVREAFSGITVQLRRRADLIPNLVEAVKGYAAHEKSTFEEITAARAAMTGTTNNVAATAAADATMTGLIGRLFAVAEAYPQLRASENFQQLQDELAGTENRIATERMRYNDAVRTYNIRIRQFPANLVASSFSFQPAPLFEAPASAKAAPQVKF